MSEISTGYVASHKITLTEKIAIAESCGFYGLISHKCSTDGYAPFDCLPCTTYKARALAATEPKGDAKT